MKRVLLLVFTLSMISLSAQNVVQKGAVMLINSSNKPLAGVEVRAMGAAPTVSDGNGTFSLVFAQGHAGDPVAINSLRKSGYEIVNDKEVRSWTISTVSVYKVVMCPAGYLEENRRKYYQIGNGIYQKRYSESLAELNKLKDESKIDQQKYDNELNRIAEELRKARIQLNFYSDKFSKINKDDLNELDAKAFTLLEQGDVEGAIKVYEDSAILEKMKSTMAMRDTAEYNKTELAKMMFKEVTLNIQKSDSTSIARTLQLLKILVNTYPDNVQYKSLYDELLNQSKTRY